MPEASLFWSIVLLAVAVALVGHGSRVGARGPVYVGTVGLLLFTLIVGLDLGHPDSPDGTLLGWPLALLAVGVAALVASLMPALRASRGGG